MPTPVASPASSPRPTSRPHGGDPFRQATGFLLGTAAAGSMFFNLLSTSISYRGVAIVTLAGGLVATAGWLRRLPTDAPLTRAAIPTLLTLALAATTAALIPIWSTPRHHPRRPCCCSPPSR